MGLILTLFLYLTYEKLKKINKFLSKIPSIIVVGTIIILILKLFKIDYLNYKATANCLSFMIAPATVALAYPLYKNSKLLVKNKRALYPSIIIGAFGAFLSVYFIAHLLKMKDLITISLLSKSTTMPIAVEISKNIGGYSELTSCAVVLTGVFGAIFGHKILNLLNVKSDTAIGLAIGCASHVIGTASCAERNKPRQVSSATIGLILAGLISSIVIPLIFNVNFCKISM